ncbi:MAG: stage II sporulation protein M [Archaeoglobaceae archaeon]
MIKIVFVALTLIFLGSCYLGYLLAETYPSVVEKEIETIREFFRSLSSEKISPLEIFALIFLNNSIKSFIAMLLGVFFGVIPILFIFLNGLIIGFFASFIGSEIGIITFLLLLLPHGILEIPAVILACSYGFLLGVEFLRDRKNLRKHVSKAILNFVRFVLPMLLVAAFIETILISLL